MQQTNGQDSSGAPPVLDVRAVSRRFGDGDAEVAALDGVSIRVGPGEMVALMGASGSGKTTLLTIAGGLDEPSSGEVVVAGQTITGLGSADRAAIRRRSLGFVFQELNLVSGLTATENVALPLELDGVGSGEASAAARERLGAVGLEDRLDSFPDDLSGGERQRVAIARALIGTRRLVLADEPTGALDSGNGERIMDLLRGAADDGAAVVVVTHDASIAARADRTLALHDGRLSHEHRAGSSSDLAAK